MENNSLGFVKGGFAPTFIIHATLGGTSKNIGDTNFNDLTTAGMYFINGTITNGPAELIGSTILAIVIRIGGRPFQICISQYYGDAGKFWFRVLIDKWYDWRASN